MTVLVDTSVLSLALLRRNKTPEPTAVAQLRGMLETGERVVTLNRRDFIAIHRSGVRHPGIVVCSVDRDCIALAGRIHQALSAQLRLVNELVRVPRGGA